MAVMILAELLSRVDCMKRYGSDYFTEKQIREGQLFRIEKGVFAERASVPETALLSWKYPKAESAFTGDYMYYEILP